MVDPNILNYIDSKLDIEVYGRALFLYSLTASGNYAFYDTVEENLEMEGMIGDYHLMNLLRTAAEQLNASLKGRVDMFVLLASAVVDVKRTLGGWLVEYLYMPSQYEYIPARRELWIPE